MIYHETFLPKKFAYVAGELFIGLVLPIVFVSSYPSLNERFGGTVLASLESWSAGIQEFNKEIG